MLKGLYSRETTYLSIGPTHQTHLTHQSTGPIDFHEWPDSGKLWWSTIYVQPCSCLRLRCSNAHACFRANDASLYCPPVFCVVSGDFKIQNSLLLKNNRWIKIDHQWSSSQVHFPSAQIILQSHLDILANITEICMNIDKDLRITSSNCTRVAAQTCPVQRDTISYYPWSFWGALQSLSIGIPFSSFMHDSCTLLRGTQMANQPITIKSISL